MFVVAVYIYQKRFEFAAKVNIIIWTTQTAFLSKLEKSNPADGTLFGIQFLEFLDRLIKFQLLFEHARQSGCGQRRFLFRLEILFGTVRTEMQSQQLISGQIRDVKGSGLLTLLTFHFMFSNQPSSFKPVRLQVWVVSNNHLARDCRTIESYPAPHPDTR